MGAYCSVEEEHVLLVSFQVDQQLMNNLMLTTGACKREGEKMKKLHTYYLYKLFYFCSCGNKAFAVNSKGDIIWESKTFNDTGYTFDSLLKFSPALHLDKKLLIFVNTHSTELYVLSLSDGSVQGIYSIREYSGFSGCIEPPLLVGESVYIIKADSNSITYLYSIPL